MNRGIGATVTPSNSLQRTVKSVTPFAFAKPRLFRLPLNSGVRRPSVRLTFFITILILTNGCGEEKSFLGQKVEHIEFPGSRVAVTNSDGSGLIKLWRSARTFEQVTDDIYRTLIPNGDVTVLRFDEFGTIIEQSIEHVDEPTYRTLRKQMIEGLTPNDSLQRTQSCTFGLASYAR